MRSFEKWLGGVSVALLLAGCSTTSPQLAKTSPLAVQKGDELTLFHNGQVIGRRKSHPKDCGGFDTCEIWRFIGPIRLQDRPATTLADFALLRFEHGEGGNEVVIDKAGKDFPLWGYNAMAAPDGRFIATGSEEMDEMNGSSTLSIKDWLGGEEAIVFQPSCRPVKWISATSLSVTCEHYPEYKEGEPRVWRFDATTERVGVAEWTLTATRWIMHADDPKPGNRPLPTFESQPLKDFFSE